jgi:hypothetical protein
LLDLKLFESLFLLLNLLALVFALLEDQMRWHNVLVFLMLIIMNLLRLLLGPLEIQEPLPLKV